MAVHTFLCTLVANNLDTRMVNMSCFVPDGYPAALTPVLMTAGLPMWLEVTGFAVSTINQDGFLNWTFTAPDYFADVYDTGVVPSVDLALNDVGISLMVVEKDNSVLGYETGSQAAVGFDALALASYFVFASGEAMFECWNQNNPNGYIRYSWPGAEIGLGFFSGNRTAANAFALHYGRFGVVNLLQAKNTTAGNRPNFNLYVFGENIGGFTFNSCLDRMAFYAVHLSLNPTEINILYQAVRQLRTDLGGVVV